MPPNFKFDQGENTSNARSDLETGELQQSMGAEYVQGDRSGVWKQRGRTAFGDTGSGAKVAGVGVLKFDSGTNDQVVALSGTTLYGATPGTTGTFASLKTGLSASAVTLDSAHFNDRHYLVNGFDKMQVLENEKTVRVAGLESPQVAPTIVASVGGTTLNRPTATLSSTAVTNPDDAWDTDLETFAAATVDSDTTSATATYGSWAPSATGKVKIKFLLAGLQTGGDFPSDSSDWGSFGDMSIRSRFNVTIKLEVSEDSGATFTTALEEVRIFAMGQILSHDHDISADSALVHVKATITYNSGSAAATLRIYDVRIQAGGAVANFSHTIGAFWALSEYDATTGRESPLGPQSKLTLLSTENLATITGAAVVRNAAATHMRLYRTPDGGTVPGQLGLVGQFVAGVSKTFLDDFSVWAFDEQPLPLSPRFPVQVPGGDHVTYFPRDTPPPILDFVVRYQGVLAGGKGRALFMSTGRPESWPEINMIDSFPFPENDSLVNAVVVGDNLLLGAKDLMIVLNGLPVLQGNSFFLPTAKPLSGQPGLAAFRGITAYSVAGEPRAAWVSYWGVHETNGFTARRLTTDANWSAKVGTDVSNAVLEYDKERQLLILAVNNQHALIHLTPEHTKQNGLPKVTWGAPGRISDLASSVISGTNRIYSGHATDGKVYLENNGNTDASNSYDASGTWPLIVKSERKYYGHELYATVRANLRHSNPDASDQSLEVEWRTGHDQLRSDQVVTRTVPLTNEEGEEIFIGRAGEWAEVTLTHTGQSRFRIQDLRVVGAKVAQAGKAVA